MAGTLYLVSTPIGNLEDITLRALKVLETVDIIACEDTRRTKILLGRYSIKKPLICFHSYNQDRKSRTILKELVSGKDVAVVSDGGTPGISDPGSVLVRNALLENIPVVPIPGPTAFVTALVGSGLPTDGLVFLGFLPRKPGKMKKALSGAVGMGKTILFYESPHRIKKTLALCKEVFPETSACAVARELTKKFEEYIRGSISEVHERIAAMDKVKGELVVAVSPGKKRK